VANVRIIYRNAADTATSLAASTTAGTLVAAYMQNDYKGQAHRSTGLSVTYTLTWTDGESVGGIVLPASNLSGASTIRVRLYSDTAGTTLLADSGTLYASPGPTLGAQDWSQPLNANAFAYGGVSKTQVWFSQHYAAKCCVVDLVDTAANTAGYIDCARLVVGAYWEAAYNASYGAAADHEDTTENERNDAGDLRADLGTQHDTLTFDLDHLAEADRATARRIATTAGTHRNIVVSLIAGDGEAVAEADFLIYGKRANAAVSARMPLVYANRFDIKGW